MRSSIRVKIRIFTLRSKNVEPGTRKEEVEKHWNNSTMEGRKKKQDQGTGNVLPCLALPCRRNEITLLQLSLMRSSIRVKILIFTLRSKNLEQRTRKEEVEKQLNNSTMEGRKKKQDQGTGNVLPCLALPPE